MNSDSANINKISLRDAAMSDLPLLEHWEDQPHVIEAGIEDWPWAEDLAERPPWRSQLIAELDSRPIGFIQIIDPALEKSHYWGDVGAGFRAVDIFIGEAKDLNKGYGSIMMGVALEHCFENSQVQAVLIDPLESNTRAHQFYRRLGFEYLENRTFDEDKCSVFTLTRVSWEKILAR